MLSAAVSHVGMQVRFKTKVPHFLTDEPSRRSDKSDQDFFFRPPFLWLPFFGPGFLLPFLATPPLRPLFFVDDFYFFLPRPPPLFSPPPDSLLTVAQARRFASLLLVSRFSQPSAMCSASRFCLPLYFDLLPRAVEILLGSSTEQVLD